jgi:DNA-binding FadR family transcriptional regulator
MADDVDLRLEASRLSRADAISRHIEADISSGQVATGQRLGTKEELRRRFGVAPATLNEAIKLLNSRGLVEARSGPGGGVFVASPAARMRQGPLIMGFEWVRATAAEYRQVRSALEPIVYLEAARHHSRSQLRALYTVVARMEAHSGDLRAYIRDNTAFHRSVASMVKNVPLRSIYVTLLDFMENAVVQTEQPVTRENIEVHRELADAIAGGEGPKLERAIRHHNDMMVAEGMFERAAGGRRRRGPVAAQTRKNSRT